MKSTSKRSSPITRFLGKDEAQARQEAAMQVFEIAAAAAPYPVGTVLERREEIFRKRNNVKP